MTPVWMLSVGICSRTRFNGVSEDQNLLEDFIQKLLTINISDCSRLGCPYNRLSQDDSSQDDSSPDDSSPDDSSPDDSRSTQKPVWLNAI